MGIQNTVGSLSLDQVKGHIFDFDNWKVRKKLVWKHINLDVCQEVEAIFFLIASIFFVNSKTEVIYGHFMGQDK